MAEKQLPYMKMEEFLKTGNIAELKRLFSQCEPNAVNYSGSNVFAQKNREPISISGIVMEKRLFLK